MDNRKISLCIPTWERTNMLFESFARVIDDDRISEIIIVDDCSSEEVFQSIKDASIYLKKIKLFRNAINLDCYRNKREAISKATNEWVIILDSDNIIDTNYLDRIYDEKEWAKNIAYMPSFAMPLFNYTAYEWQAFTKSNIAQYIDKPMVSTCLNCFNYFVNRDEYLRIWQPNIDPHTADSLLHNYNWLNAGNVIYIVPNLHYKHRVHDGSHYKNNVHLTGNLYHEIENKLRQLK
jgi:glycosyltransferase involved in cell wall biosynthesis